MYQSSIDLSILVKNKPIKEYYHEGNTFIEGRNGSEYIIRVHNHGSRSTEAIISVDGINIINGKDASDSSPGYLIRAYQTLDIPCWKVNGSEGAKFCFGTKEHSYSAEIGKGTDNTGVIGVRAFYEKLYYPVYTTTVTSSFNNSSLGGSSLRAASASSESTPRGIGLSVNNASPIGSNVNNVQMCSSSISDLGQNSLDSEEVGLGTSFGESVKWSTYEVPFTRDSNAAPITLILYYDTRKNLERRGIKLDYSPELPKAFPGNNDGCPVPNNWKR
jgi:hypothetical protein